MADDPEPEMTIGELKTHVDGRFAWIGQQFAQVDQRFAQVDQRFAQVDQRFAQVDQRFEGIERRISEEHAATRRHFDIVAERLEGLLKLFAERGDVDHQRLENHETRIRALEQRRR